MGAEPLNDPAMVIGDFLLQLELADFLQGQHLSHSTSPELFQLTQQYSG